MTWGELKKEMQELKVQDYEQLVLAIDINQPSGRLEGVYFDVGGLVLANYKSLRRVLAECKNTRK